MPLSPDDLLARLREQGVAYKLYEHPPVLTVEAMMAVCGDIAGAHTKNLFLRDGKKTTFLLTLHHDAQVDLKAFRSVLGGRTLLREPGDVARATRRRERRRLAAGRPQCSTGQREDPASG